jgi:hypothetical protein
MRTFHRPAIEVCFHCLHFLHLDQVGDQPRRAEPGSSRNYARLDPHRTENWRTVDLDVVGVDVDVDDAEKTSLRCQFLLPLRGSISRLRARSAAQPVVATDLESAKPLLGAAIHGVDRGQSDLAAR